MASVIEQRAMGTDTSVAETFPDRMAAASCVVLEKTISIVLAPFYALRLSVLVL